MPMGIHGALDKALSYLAYFPYSPATNQGSWVQILPGAPFWYANSSGLVEVAVNQGHAARRLGLAVGTAVSWR